MADLGPLRLKAGPRNGILLATMAQGTWWGSRAINMRHSDLTSALSTACKEWTVRACVAFLDGPATDAHGGALIASGAYRLVGTSDYLNASLPPAKRGLDCCKEQMSERRAQGLPYRSKSLPPPFFCDPHVSQTLASQYRFLPALGYLRAQYGSDFRAGELGWLVLIDDDSEVNAAALAAVLGRHRADERLYMGDFGSSSHKPGHALKHNGSPFACGGAGSVLSGAAVLATDFVGCAEQAHRQCLQSDWMVGICVQAAGVRPVLAPTTAANATDAFSSPPSCAVCGSSCAPASKKRLRMVLRGETQCAFAQLTTYTMCHFQDPGFVNELCTWQPDKHVAIRHGWAKMCTGRNAVKRKPRRPGAARRRRLIEVPLHV